MGALELKDRSNEWGEQFWELAFDLPGEKVNKFSESVMTEFSQLLGKLEDMGSGRIKALIMTSPKPGIFIAGADIKLIQAADTAKTAEQLAATGQEMFNRWEDLPFVKVLAVNGACLGGGCELGLASDAIVMSDDKSARIGLPEVMLGIIPGLGGCVRMPRKIGIASALELILTGRFLDGKRAKKVGLAETLLPKENFEASVAAWTKKNWARLSKGERLGRSPKRGGIGGVVGSLLESPLGRGIVFGKARGGVLARTHGHYPAPLEAIKVVRATYASKRVRGGARAKRMAREAEGFGRVAATDVSKNLIRLFYLTEEVKKANGLPNGSTVQTPKVHDAGVLGAGTMGGGIAQLFADKGVTTRMKDINLEGLEIGTKAVTSLFRKKLKRRRINKREYLQKVNLVAPVLDYAGFRATDVVVEAIIEKMDIKKTVLADLEKHISDQCVIASNTSSLSISEMQGALKHPDRFVGMHFFNPVHRMPLVEVIRGEKTSDMATATIFEFSKKIGKTPIVVKDGAGFLVNRLLVPYLNEAAYLLADGAPIDEIDKALVKFGMPMGPIELIDEVGVDVGEKVLHILHAAFGDRMKPAGQVGNVVKEKRLGKKSGLGFYRYEGRKKILDPKLYDLVGVKPKSGSIRPERIVARTIFPMVNEAARCLADEIVARPHDVDLGMIMGTGFPPFRGGLLRYADSVGASAIAETLKELASEVGDRYAPCEALLERAQANRSFYE